MEKRILPFFRSDFSLDFMFGQFDTADMRPLYFVPEFISSILSDHGPDGGIFFSIKNSNPEDLNICFYCNMACRYLSEGESWDDILIKLGFPGEDLLQTYFHDFTGMSPDMYAKWCLE
jgi:hypothetical protein